jgi:hypothetical protein
VFHPLPQGKLVDTGWGQVEIVGLSEDGTTGNLVLLEFSDRAWAFGSGNR